jgi:hypothetical protein
VADFRLLEDGTSKRLLEDGTSRRLLEPPPIVISNNTGATYSGTRDGNNWGRSTNNFGTGTTWTIGHWDDANGADTRRGFLAFDGLSSVPAGTVTNAKIRLFVTAVNANASFNFHRITRSWTENGFNWDEYDGNNNWATQGGDFNATVIATTTITSSNIGTYVEISGTALTQLVQGWLNGTFANHGILIKSPTETGGSGINTSISSKEGANGQRPQLIFDFEVAGASAAVLETSASSTTTASASLTTSIRLVASPAVRVSASINSGNLLFDLYGTAKLGWSARRLSSTYTGPCLRVRRSSDNAEQDIGFVNDYLDTAAIATFCSGTNGFVTTVYGQDSTGLNATQTTVSSQPRICLAGVVDVRGAFAGFGKFIASSATSLSFSQLNYTNQLYQFIVAYVTDVGDGVARAVLAGGNGSLATRFLGQSGGQANINITSSYQVELLDSSSFTANKILQSTVSSVTNSLTARAEGSIVGTTSDASGKFISVIGREASGTEEMYNDIIFEIVVYDTDKSAVRAGIESNQSAYFTSVAAALASSISSTTTTSASLSTAIRLNANATAISTSSGNVTNFIRFASSVNCTVLGTGSITTQINLAANASANAVSGANLSAEIKVNTSIANDANVTGDLTTSIKLVASAANLNTVITSLNTGIPIFASVTDLVTSTANISTAIRLNSSSTEVLASDDFNGTSGTDLSAYNSVWTKHPLIALGAMALSSTGRVYSSSNQTTLYYYNKQSTFADYSVSADFHYISSSATAPAIAARVNSTANTLYMVRYSQSGAFELFVFVNGGFTTLGTFAQTLTVGSVTNLRLEVQGTSQRVYVDNVLRISTNDTQVTAAGFAAVRAFSPAPDTNTTGIHLDNFLVKELRYGANIAGSLTSPVNLVAIANVIQSSVTANLTTNIKLVASAANLNTVITSLNTGIPLFANAIINATGTSNLLTTIKLKASAIYESGSDNFNGTANTELSTYNSDWVKHPLTPSGLLRITSLGRVYSDASVSAAYYFNTALTSADYSVSCTIINKEFGNSAFGVTARTSSTATTAYLARYNVSIGRYELYAFVNGAVTLLGTLEQPLAVNNTATIRLDVEGTSQKVYINGVLSISANDTQISAAGFAGIRVFSSSPDFDSTGPHLDNFSFNQLKYGSTSTATISTAIQLVASSSNLNTVISSLNTGIPLFANFTDLVTANSELNTSIRLASNVSSVTTVTANLTTAAFISVALGPFNNDAINLTALNGTDWLHYSNYSVPPGQRKRGGGSLITNLDFNAPSYRNDTTYRDITWTDGFPTLVGTNGYDAGLYGDDGDYVVNVGYGFSFTVPATIATSQVKVISSVRGGGTFSVIATLSGGGFPPQTATTTFVADAFKYSFTSTINYNSSTVGQTLSVQVIKASQDGGGEGYVAFQAAVLTISNSKAVLASVGDVVSATASLSTNIRLASSRAVQSTASASLSVGNPIASSVANVATASATLTTAAFISVDLSPFNTDTVNLTAFNGTDWFLYSASNVTTRKRGGGSLIQYPNLIADNFRTDTTPRIINWTDGTPNLVDSNTYFLPQFGYDAGLFGDNGDGLVNVGMGSSFTVPAGIATSQLKVICSVRAGGSYSIVASLSGGGFPTQTATTAVYPVPVGNDGKSSFTATINFNSATAGQTLTVQAIKASENGSAYESYVALSAVVLTISNSKAVLASVSNVATATANLSTTIRLVASSSNLNTVITSLNTGIPLFASATNVVSATGLIATAIRLSSSVSVISTSACNLSAQIRLNSSITNRVTADATLSSGELIVGSISAISAASANLTTAIRLEGSSTNNSSINANINTGIRLLASLNNTVSAASSATTVIKLASNLAIQSTSTANLSTAIRLVASSSNINTVVSSLNTGIPLFANIADVASITGNISTAIRLSSSLINTVSSTGILTTSIQVVGSIGNLTTALAALNTSIRLFGSLNNAVSIESSINTAIRLNANAFSQSSAVPTLSTRINLLGFVQGNSNSQANISTSIFLQTSAIVVATIVPIVLTTGVAKYVPIQVQTSLNTLTPYNIPVSVIFFREISVSEITKQDIPVSYIEVNLEPTISVITKQETPLFDITDLHE